LKAATWLYTYEELFGRVEDTRVGPGIRKKGTQKKKAVQEGYRATMGFGRVENMRVGPRIRKKGTPKKKGAQEGFRATNDALSKS